MQRFLFPIVFLVPTLVSCGKKVDETPPPVGWASEGTEEVPWAGDCYYPPEYESLAESQSLTFAETDRRIARQVALEGMKSQWLGQREDGVSFDAMMIDDLETILLGRPTEIEDMSRQNLSYCKQVMGAGASTSEWSSWLSGLPAVLTEGECNTPFDYQLIQYLDIKTGWQQPIPFCQGNRAVFNATANDQYRISEDGDWMNVNGDLAQPSTSSEYPCNFEGCTVGMLVGKFVTESGIETIYPMGTEMRFEAPEHGTFYWTINDTTYYDNEWHKAGSIVDHTAITVTPE